MRTLVLLVLLALLIPGPVVLAGSGSPSAQVGKTGKERLSDKASDEQRMDDCKVPPARRTRPRPAGCAVAR